MDRYRHSLRIAIIGGGLGGLAAAMALQNEGFNVTVFERDFQFSDRKQGYGLTLTNNPKGPLAKLGILNEVCSKDCCSNQHWIFRPSGQICGYYGRALKGSKKTSDFEKQDELTDNNINNNQTSNLRGNIRIPRQELRRILLQRLDPGTVKWGRRLVSYHDDFNEVKLEFECIDTSNQQSQQSEFEKEIVMADVVVGADGINSKIRQHRDQQNIDLNPPPLQYTGVSVIIGLSAAKHPLLTRGGFYVLDGSQRLFVMPFQEETICSCVDRNSDSKDGSESVPLSSSTSPCAVCGRGQQQLTMWQLSFAYPDSEPDLCLSSMNRISLIAEALRRTDGWMEPVQDLVRLTLPEDSAVWGTKLYDCDPMVLRPKNKQSSSKRKFNTDIQETDKLYTSSSRITVLGDACHPMSMFKGQGCNQAMEDGPLLASWLGRPGLSAENLYTRLRCFEREMISRTTPKVAGSREAAHLYHSSEALKVDFGFEGLTSQQGQTLIAELNERNITAALGMKMEPAVIKLAHEIVNVEKE